MDVNHEVIIMLHLSLHVNMDVNHEELPTMLMFSPHYSIDLAT